MYTHKQRMEAINVYMKYDRSVCATIHELGYPSPNMLRRWYKKYLENGFVHANYQKKSKFTEEQKETAVFSLLQREEPVEKLANKIGVERETLYKWKNQLVGKESPCKMITVDKKTADPNILRNNIYLLEKQISQLKLEKDILETAVNKLKKQ